MQKAEPMAYGVPMVSIVGDGFCAPYPVELTLKKKDYGLLSSIYEALDANGRLVLQVTPGFRNLQKKRVLRDPAGLPLLTMREKVMTWRHRWTVHRGESKDQNEALFSMQRSNALQITQFRHDVFLSSNVVEDIPNFHVVETHAYKSYRIYKGDTLIAEVNHELSWGGFWKGKRNFKIRIYPGVDYAFVVALVVMLNENDIACI